MKFIPLEDNVLVESTAKQEKVGAIYLPDQGKQESGEAIVISVGDKVKTVKPGDRVATERYGGRGVKMGNKEYRLFRASDILGIIET